MKYKGEKCTACGEAFTADDDIVVCPECGSPHHRDCYMKLGRCANIALHASGDKWRPSGVISFPDKPAPAEDDNIICPECQALNPKDAEKCEKCGADLGNGEQPDPFAEYIDSEFENVKPYLGFDPEENMGGATLREVSQFVCANTIYYIPIFKHMKDFGSKLSFNLSCLLFPYFYFANRKMWGWAVISAIIKILLGMPELFLTVDKQIPTNSTTEKFLSAIYDHQSRLETLDSYFTVINWGVSIAFCLLGNWLYYRYTMKSLRRIKSQSSTPPAAEKLMAAGGVKPVNIIYITLIMGAIGLAFVYAGSKLLYS